MRTPGGEGQHNSVGAAAKQVADHAKNLVGLELELAGLEMKRKATSLGLGAVLVVGGAILGLYALGFLLLTVAAALATALSLWLSLLIVALLLLGLAGVLGLVGARKIRSATPPVPEQAITEAKRTTEALKGNGSHG
jgi:uncharacterized membrane protein YqjE